MEWNKNEWQGKRKDQVDFTQKVLVVSLLLLAMSAFAIIITS